MVELFITNQHHGSNISTYKVLEPTYSFKLKDIGECQWSLALSQLNILDRPIEADEFASVRTDYLLRASDNRGQSFTNLQGGRLTDVDLESDTGVIKCTGKDWLEYMEQPYPLDYSLTPATITKDVSGAFLAFVTGAGTDTANVKYNATQQKVISTLLTGANGLSDIDYTANFLGTGWTQILQYMVQYLDGTTMLDHIKAIGNLRDPWGFDFWCEWNKTINFYAPRLVTDPDNVFTVLDLVYGDEPVVKAKWHNKGPTATRTVAQNGVGVWDQSIFQDSIDEFRDFLEIVGLGEHFNFARTLEEIQNIVNAAAGALGQLHRNPQKDLTLTVLPNLLFPDNEIGGFTQLIGQALNYHSGEMFLPYHTVDADYWIVSQDFRSDDDSGNYVCDLGLQQIYPIN